MSVLKFEAVDLEMCLTQKVILHVHSLNSLGSIIYLNQTHEISFPKGYRNYVYTITYALCLW